MLIIPFVFRVLESQVIGLCHRHLRAGLKWELFAYPTSTAGIQMADVFPLAGIFQEFGDNITQTTYFAKHTST
jgi:hypothetical protein